MACRGPVRSKLKTEKPSNLNLPDFVLGVSVARPGVLGIATKRFTSYAQAAEEIDILSKYLETINLDGFPLIVLTEDDGFLSETLNNFLWVTFTRANPSHDIYGVKSTIEHKHWGCDGPLIIDARIKEHHAPILEKDPAVTAKVDKLFSKGGDLYNV
jgi:4-hydroxy-3-polyprenylbenzoate decarboxylase